MTQLKQLWAHPTLRRYGVIAFAALCLITGFQRQASAAWFEAKGQAVVFDQNKEAALSSATQDAIKHALLFAGASIHSVQTLTNGLLSSDQFEIRSGGEVNQLELVSEQWSGDIVTVTIRANIYPQGESCDAAQFSKSIVSTYFPIKNRQQATDGRIHQLGEALPVRFKSVLAQQADFVSIDHIADYSAKWTDTRLDQQVPEFARQESSQFVLAGQINDISIDRETSSKLAFWKRDKATRYFDMDVKLLDGISGAVLFTQNYRMSAPWTYDRFDTADVFGQAFWNSPFGTELERTLERLATDLDGVLICQPATGRVLTVDNNRVTVSMGQAQGLKVGDKLSLYQMSEFIDTYGNKHLKYNIHPDPVIVVSSYVDNAIVESANGSLLTNIQPNDFVAKR